MMDVTSGYWVAVFISICATAMLLVRFSFLCAEYVKLTSSPNPHESEAAGEKVESPRNEVKQPARKAKAAKKKTAKKSKKKKKKN
jgi:hypothetical protein